MVVAIKIMFIILPGFQDVLEACSEAQFQGLAHTIPCSLDSGRVSHESSFLSSFDPPSPAFLLKLRIVLLKRIAGVC